MEPKLPRNMARRRERHKRHVAGLTHAREDMGRALQQKSWVIWIAMAVMLAVLCVGGLLLLGVLLATTGHEWRLEANRLVPPWLMSMLSVDINARASVAGRTSAPAWGEPMQSTTTGQGTTFHGPDDVHEAVTRVGPPQDPHQRLY